MALPDAGMPRVADAGVTVAPVRVDVGGDPDVEYRLIPGASRYAVGEDGSYWSRCQGKWRPLKGRIDVDGYRFVGPIWDDGLRRCTFVHSLVLTVFVGPRPIGMQGCHNDGDTANNRAGNLRWGTPLDNAHDRQRHGTYDFGSRHHKAKLSEAQVKQVWAMLRKKVSQTTIAVKFGVHQTNISCIARGITWDHLTSQLKPI